MIRPSSKSTSHLTVSWKVADGVYQHIDVKEENKQHYFSIGKTLLIGSEVSYFLSINFELKASTLAKTSPLIRDLIRDFAFDKIYLDVIGLFADLFAKIASFHFPIYWIKL